MSPHTSRYYSDYPCLPTYPMLIILKYFEPSSSKFQTFKYAALIAAAILNEPLCARVHNTYITFPLQVPTQFCDPTVPMFNK